MKSILNMLWEDIESSIDENGMGLGKGFARQEDDKLTMMAIAMDGNGPEDSFMFAMGSLYAVIEGIRNPSDARVVEAVMALDFWSKTGQGTEFKDVVCIFHWQGRYEWNYGLVDYQKPSIVADKIVRPINWNHPHWGPYMRRMHTSFRQQHRPLKLTLKKADGTEVSW